MRKGLLTLYCVYCSVLVSAQNDWGRGADIDEDTPFDFDSALFAFFCGIAFIAIGVVLRYLYNRKWYYKDFLKTISTILIGFGALSLLPFIQYIWKYLIYGILALLFLGYIVYRIIIKKDGGDKEMKSFSYYLNVILGGIIYIVQKITGKE